MEKETRNRADARYHHTIECVYKHHYVIAFRFFSRDYEKTPLQTANNMKKENVKKFSFVFFFFSSFELMSLRFPTSLSATSTQLITHYISGISPRYSEVTAAAAQLRKLK